MNCTVTTDNKRTETFKKFDSNKSLTFQITIKNVAPTKDWLCKSHFKNLTPTKVWNTKSHLRNISRSWLAEKFGIQNHTWERFQEFHSHKSLKYKITFKKHFRSWTPRKVWGGGGARIEEDFKNFPPSKVWKSHLRNIWLPGKFGEEVAPGLKLLEPGGASYLENTRTSRNLR